MTICDSVLLWYFYTLTDQLMSMALPGENGQTFQEGCQLP